MRKFLRWMGKKLGMTTYYHVAAMYPISSGGFATVSYTCSVRPWLHGDNYALLVEHTKTQAKHEGAEPNILSITRLGI